jgi:ribosomal protein S18 acetylase RimI-like enzyme
MSYRFREECPNPEEYVALREAAGMKPRSEAAARRGLPNTLYAVTVREQAGRDDATGDDSDDGTAGDLVGMGRVIGDDGCFYQLVDIAVHPDHQRQGLGTRVVTELMKYVEETAPPSAYTFLISDVDGFYEQFGFEDAGPESKGMFLRVGDL